MSEFDSMFAEVEKRVEALVKENRDLKARLSQMERELDSVRREANELQHFQSKRLHIREKIEKILGVLNEIEHGRM